MTSISDLYQFEEYLNYDSQPLPKNTWNNSMLQNDEALMNVRK